MVTITDGIAEFQLNNPKNLNALSSEVMEDLYDNLYDIEKKARVLLIYGIEKAFAAGMDITEIEKYDYESAHLNLLIDEHWEKLLNLKIPVIAAVSGYALGGGFELVLACDIVIAAKNAKFGFPEVNLGIMPGLGGTQLLTHTIGPKRAAQYLMSGDFMSVETAYDFGIVGQISENVLDDARSLAKKLSEKSPMSLRLIKEAVRLAQNCGLSQGMQVERTMFHSLFATEDKKTRVAQFLSKKK